jgi:trehalose-6-phosphate synthase
MIVVSHRGPYRFEPRGDGSFSTHRSAGGVGSALRSGIEEESEATWIAAAFSDDDREAARSGALEDSGVDLRMVAIESDIHALHYDVISNGVLWFLFHGLFDRVRRPAFDQRFREAWQAYTAVNAAFAKTTAEAAAPNECCESPRGCAPSRRTAPRLHSREARVRRRDRRTGCA